MKWRTDKPTAKLIIADIIGSRYPEVLKLGSDCYYETIEHLPVDYVYIEKWADLEEDETVTDCNEYSTVEEELDAFIKSGKAIKEENCGTYTTTYIDPLKVARHFVKWGAEHLKTE
jgi:hypothetical protein